MSRATAALCAAALAAVAGLGTASAQTLVAFSSNGVRAPLEELVAQCPRVGRPVSVSYGTSAAIKQRVAGGEAVDVVFATSEVVAELAQGGHVAPGSITPLGRAGIGLGIRSGGRKPAIGTADEIKQALLAAQSVAYAQDGASRRHIERMFAQLGIADEMQAKTLLEQGSVRAAEKVVAGEAEILLTLVSEILPVAGMDLLGLVPTQFQSHIAFEAAIGVHAEDASAARDLVACVAAPAAAATFAAKGIER
jgi:molybdate transport system substrate-binding protein